MRGWILDLYPGNPGEMVVWLKLENGDAVRLVDRWSPSIFIGTDNKSDFAVPLQTLRDDFAWTRVVRRQERISVPGESEVVEAKLRDARRAVQVAGRIERLGPFGTFRLYNIDIPPNQSYLYDHDLFPLAYCEVERDRDRLSWKLKDDVWEYEYAIPKLRKTKLEVQIDQQGRLPRFTDRITSITLEGSGGKTVIEGRSEADKLLELMRATREADPDFILTNDGDTFLFPYLIKRSEANGLALTLDRDATVMKLPSKAGTSYFSYGQIHYKPSAMKLYGRLHIDINTSFAYSEAGFEGLFELSRICRMPLQTSSRATIGKALSSLQCYHASKMGLLVPWKPTLWEHFKDRNELLLADRGGFIFEPRIGVHENVGELDFSALFPNIMLRKNISAETIKCLCCPDSTNRVPELGWNVCEKKMGLVAKSMEIVVGKRLRYKELKSNAAGDARKIYDERQAALKWIGVVCLPKESPVFVTQDGIEKFVRIGDFIDSIVGKRTGVMKCPSDVYVAGIGPDYKAKYARVANLIKKPNRQNLLSIDMEDGRKIVATPDHPFFILREGELKVIMASELEVGEALPVAKRIPSLSRTTDQIDLIGSLEKTLERMSSRKLSGDQIGQTSRSNRLLHGDLGFVRVRKITMLDSCPEYVYCFELADDEVPGFFTGEGLVFTHNCFGYLGHSNAKFGRIDAHISVCAWDRKILIDATRIAERKGFEVLHGIVDSLWLKKAGANESDYLDLKAKIEEETGFAISFEGIYKWVVFLPSKVDPGIPVLNRYFGVYRDGELKVRGIEARRHDTPLAFSRCQMEILRTLAEADSVAEAKAKVPGCVEIFLRHAESLARHEIPAPELAFTTNLSKAPEEYTTMTVQNAAIKQLVGEGATLHAGEGIRYVITDYRGKDSKRATPADVIQDETKYDSERYIELLAETCSSVLEPFDPRCTGSGLLAAYEARRSVALS